MKVNRAEAAELLGADMPDAASAATAISQTCWGRDVVVTDGVRGGAARSAESICRSPASATVGRFSGRKR